METVLITGAGTGMGLCCVTTLMNKGWHVLAVDRNADRLCQFSNNAQIRTLCADVTAQDFPTQVLAALKEMPPWRGLVNMAGISMGSPIETLDEELWHRSFATNVDAPMRLIQLAATTMVSGGSILNVGSSVGIIGANKPSYAASKAALHGLTMSCARNLGPKNIRVNVLFPGPTITNMTKDWSPERRNEIAQKSFLKRLCTVEEVAETISFFLSNQSSYFTGSVIDMTGGNMWGN